MIRYSSAHTINVPPAVVFEALLDAARYGEWTEMQGTTWDGDGPVRVGTTGSFRMPSGPFAGALRMEVVELQPDHRFVARVTHPKFDWVSTADLEADGPGTRMTYAGEMRFRGCSACSSHSSAARSPAGRRRKWSVSRPSSRARR